VAPGNAALLGDGVLLKVGDGVEPAFRPVAPEALPHATNANNARRTTAFMQPETRTSAAGYDALS